MSTVKDIQDILADDDKLTQVTKAVFDAVDADGSGKIDRKELKAAMINVAREARLDPPSDEKVDEALQKLDTDGSGNIDVHEFKELIKQLLEALLE
jgi:Ca2+-binding EF-hand superfamily protein